MGSANWIALAAVVSVTLVGLVGPIINGIQQRRAEHERHDRDRKANTYIDVLSSLERDYAWMERTYPIIGIDRMPDPPAPLTDQEFWTLRARVAAYGSDRAKALLEHWNQKITREFWLGAMLLRDMEEAGKMSRAISRQEWGTTRTDQYRKLQGIRGEARKRLEEIQRVVASELQIAPPSAARQDPSDRFNAWLERNGREQLPQRDDRAG
jgi:hypothetical protein